MWTWSCFLDIKNSRMQDASFDSGKSTGKCDILLSGVLPEADDRIFNSDSLIGHLLTI
jgi:hypothetical protein